MEFNTDDISLEQLAKTDWISQSAINICQNNGFKGLSDIILFHKKNISFTQLSNCGEKFEKELSQICKSFSNYTLDEIIENIFSCSEVKRHVKGFTAEQIKETNLQIEILLFNLSVRARNGLLSLVAGVPSIIELVEIIYTASFNFKTIRNVGDKSVSELDNFKKELSSYINKYKLHDNDINAEESINPTELVRTDKGFVELINNFSPFKKSSINRHIEYLISNLCVRARNGLILYFGTNFSSKEIIEKIYSLSFNFGELKNIGAKTVTELKNFKNDISNFIITIRFLEDNQLSKEYTKLIIKTTFNNIPNNFNESFEEIIEDSGKVKIFTLLNYLLKNGNLLKEKEKELFSLIYTENYNKNINQIASNLNLTKERIRQLKIKLEDEIENHFSFILNFKLEDFVDYGITTSINFKTIDNNFKQSINLAEEVNFNVLFYSIIFGLLLKNSHSILGDDETIYGKQNYPNKVGYKNCYLVKKEIFDSFNFEIFIKDVNRKLSERIHESYALYFEGYLIEFIKNEGKLYLSLIAEICEVILYNEFDIVINNDGYIQFDSNRKRTLLKYIEEELEILGEMTKIDDITSIIKEKYPNLEITEQSVRSILQREKNLFIFIGRTSTYGLKKWQEERENLKGGTIRDIVEEILLKNHEPMHISEILKYVLRFRNTNEANVKGNIKLEENNRFQFFNGEFIGLRGKHYKNTDKYKRISGSHFRLSVFRSMNGWDLNDVVKYFVRNFKYSDIQVKAVIEKKIALGELSVTSNNKLII